MRNAMLITGFMLLAGCAGQQGVSTFEGAVAELGAPVRCQDADDGGRTCAWPDVGPGSTAAGGRLLVIRFDPVGRIVERGWQNSLQR